MMKVEQVKINKIAYWSDGYFIREEDALEQAEILDSVNAFGGEHSVLEAPKGASNKVIKMLITQALNQST